MKFAFVFAFASVFVFAFVFAFAFVSWVFCPISKVNGGKGDP